MILVRVEPSTKHVTMLSIPRDLWVPLSTGGSAKIDAAYAYGGPAAATTTVERNFHVHIDEYAWVGLKGLIKLIDRLGGVDLLVTNPVLDDGYPDDIDSAFLCGYKRVRGATRPQHLDRSRALQYVRPRHNDINGNFGRSARQQEVVLAIKAKASTLKCGGPPRHRPHAQGQFQDQHGPRPGAELAERRDGLRYGQRQAGRALCAHLHKLRSRTGVWRSERRDPSLVPDPRRDVWANFP
jgi:LCP family protein required for cell wall assembly